MRNSKEINPNIGALSERFLKISIATKVRGKIPISEAIKINSSWRLVKIRAVKKAEIATYFGEYFLVHWPICLIRESNKKGSYNDGNA